MVVTLRNTSRHVKVNDVPARVWEGSTEDGTRVACLMVRIEALGRHNPYQFRDELARDALPSPAAARAFPLKVVV